jgi:ABC-type spermidine/putrescine transport system permease subunit II
MSDAKAEGECDMKRNSPGAIRRLVFACLLALVLLLLWGPYGVLGRLLAPQGIQVMFTAWAIILANIFVTFPLAFGVIEPVYDTMSRSLEEASATIGATRWQTFWYVTLPSPRGAIVTGALLTFARRRPDHISRAAQLHARHRTGQPRRSHIKKSAMN